VALVDVVVVSFNSRASLRACVEPLATLDDVNVIVVDNASPDRSLEVVADLPIQRISLTSNAGFAHGCNVGIRHGDGLYVLLLNPDAEIAQASIETLVRVLEEHPETGAVAPRIVGRDGHLDFSLRRFPRLRSTFAQAVFLHRVFPRASWTDELVRDEEAYAHAGSPEWVSGACLLLRRTALETLGGLDDGFFMYSEDVDLCKRLRDEGFGLRFEPAATVVHEGGASAPRSALLPVLAFSKIRYAKKHRGRTYAAFERIGVGVGALAHTVVARGGISQRVGHARSLRAVFSPIPVDGPSSRTARRA
jgi:N-acetylglucosaminyl-diphospho-decaprenol L-rhamnosyltransferase